MSNGSGVSIEASDGSEVGVGKNFAGSNLTETVSTITNNEDTREVIEAVSELYGKVQQDNPLVAHFLDALMTAFDDRGKTIDNLSKLTAKMSTESNVVIQDLRNDLSDLHRQHNKLELALHTANSNYDKIVDREKYNREQIKELKRTCVLSMRLKWSVAICAFVFTLQSGAFVFWLWWVSNAGAVAHP